MTPRQQEIYGYIARRILAYDPPSVREIGSHFRMTQNGVVGHLVALEKAGVIKRLDGLARGIRLTKPRKALSDSVRQAIVDLVEVIESVRVREMPPRQQVEDALKGAQAALDLLAGGPSDAEGEIW